MNIFVFGSNIAGRHGAGSALFAKKCHGAANGVGIGFQGRSYAIPTKDSRLNVLPLDVIAGHVEKFIKFAQHHPEHTFEIVAIGCGLAGYTPHDIAPMFKLAPPNCNLPQEFIEELNRA